MDAPAKLEVLPPGTRVRLGSHNYSDATDGRIISVSIHADYSVWYQVEWWDRRARSCEMMPRELFFLVSETEPLVIGFSTSTEGNS